MTLYKYSGIYNYLITYANIADISLIYYMRTQVVSVPDAVRDIITRNRSLYDCIKMDLINYTALAVKIQKEVESLINGPVNINTIVVAIKRYADSFEKKDEIQGEPVLKNARVSLTDGIVDIKFSSDDFEMKDAV